MRQPVEVPTIKLLNQIDQILPTCPVSTPNLFPLASLLLFPCIHVPFLLLGLTGFKIKRKEERTRAQHKKATLQVLSSLPPYTPSTCPKSSQNYTDTTHY